MSWSSGMVYSPTRRASYPSRWQSLVCKILILLLGLSETNTIGYYDGNDKKISHRRALLGCSSGPLGVLASRVQHTRSTSWQRREARQWLVPLPEEVGAPPSLPRSMPHTKTTHYATEWHRRPQQATPHYGDGREGGL